jgi:DNA-binding response OmpR family regulator
LVVEDKENVRTVLEYNLKLDGFEVYLASDGPAGRWVGLAALGVLRELVKVCLILLGESLTRRQPVWYK